MITFQIFFLLKKKDKQITFLHVYHHCGMIFFAWILAKYFGSGQIVFIAFFNSFVHIWMYFYYLLTVIQKEYNKSVWWKKHLTELQLVNENNEKLVRTINNNLMFIFSYNFFADFAYKSTHYSHSNVIIHCRH